MSIFVKLCRSVIRRNKLLTAGIFVMSVLSVAIAWLGANFGPASSDTVLGFVADSGTPDAVYVTDMMPVSTGETLGSIDGVRIVSPGLLYDTNIETEDGSLFSVRIFRRGSDTPFRHAVHEEIAYDGAEPRVAVSSKFAEHNGLHPGDRITADTPLGKKEMVVTATVSSPETLSCVKDEMSAFESYQFAYLYLDEEDFNRAFPLKTRANQWLVWFEDGLSPEARESSMEAIREELGDLLESETLTDESEGMNHIRDDLHTISVLCSFIPGVIWLISLGFNFIFIRIIVENQRKTIGLLRSLGYTVRAVVLLFVVYTVLINLPALFLGALAGDRLLRMCLGLLAQAEGILTVTVTVDPWLTAGMLLMVFVIGILASLMSTRAIAGIDPVVAAGADNVSDFEPPAFIRRLKTDAFVKISAVSTVRRLKRQIVGGLCVTACIVSMCIGFEGYQSIGYPIDAVFGGRYRYDLAVRNITGDEISRIERDVTGLAAVEPLTTFTVEMLGKTFTVSTASDTDELTVLTDASGNRLFPGDGLIIDEMTAQIHQISVGDTVLLDGEALPVTGIAREILFPVMYLSSPTAEKLGHPGPNAVLLKTDGSRPISEVEQQITCLCEDAYLVEYKSQKENIRDDYVAMRTIMLVFAILAFGIGSLLILNITVIDFYENRTRYATLRAMGIPVGRLGIISVIQNLLRVVPGILLACPLCYVTVSMLLGLLSGASQQYVMVRFAGCLALSCGIPTVYVLLGMIISLRKIRQMDFCGIMNE